MAIPEQFFRPATFPFAAKEHSMDSKQREFIEDLEQFINRTKQRPAFRGKQQSLTALERIRNLAKFR